MLDRKSERLAVRDVSPHRRIGELVSNVIPPERKTLLIRDDRQHEAIELAPQDDILVLLDHPASGDIAEVVVAHSQTPDIAVGFDLYRKSKDETILFIDPLVKIGDDWRLQEADNTPEESTFQTLELELTEETGFLCGVQNDAPFVIEIDQAHTVTKCRIWDAQNSCWKIIPQPVNPDYVTSLLPYVSAVTSANPDVTEGGGAIVTGMSEVNTLDPVLARMKEEKARRNPSQMWGRELTHMASHIVSGIEGQGTKDMKVIFTPEWMFEGEPMGNGSTPRRSRMGGVIEHLSYIKGLRGLEGNHFIWGTSFCRADTKEVLQYFSLAKALEAKGITDAHAAYFVDPNAHSTKELLEAMARDFNLDYDMFVDTLQLEPGRAIPLENHRGELETSDMQLMQERHLLPPSFYAAPRGELFDTLTSNSQMAEVVGIWKEAANIVAQRADETSKTMTFGDWRVEVDRITIARLAEKLGVSPDFVRVVSMEDVIAATPGMTANKVVEQVKHMWREHKPRLQKALLGDVVQSEDGEDMPMVFRLVMPDGRRIGINTEYQPVDLQTREVMTDDFAREVAGSLRAGGARGTDHSMRLQEAFSKYPLQFSGLGYYMYTKALSHTNDRDAHSPAHYQSVMIIDDYEQSLGPTAAGMALYEHMRVVPMSMPKGLVGIRTPTQIDFDTTPDVSAFLSLPDEEFARVETFVQSTAGTLLGNDIGSATGVVIDCAENKVTDVTRIASRRQMLALTEEVNPQAVQAELDTSHYDYRRARFIPTAMMALRPENMSPLFRGFFDTSDEVGHRLGAMRSVLMMAEQTGAALPAVTEYTQALAQIDALLLHGEALAKSISSESLDASEWMTYWHNNNEALTVAAYRSGMTLIPLDRKSLADVPSLERTAQGLNGLYRAQVESRISSEMSTKRPEYVIELNQALQELNRRMAEYDLAKNATTLLGKFNEAEQHESEPEAPNILVKSFTDVDLATFKNGMLAEQMELKRPAMIELLTRVGSSIVADPGVEAQFREQAQQEHDPRLTWAINKATEIIRRTKKGSTPDFTKASFDLDYDDMDAISQRATARFQGQMERVAAITGIALPDQVFKEKGRLHAKFDRWKDEVTQKIALINVTADVQGIDPEQIAAIFAGKVDGNARAELKKQYDAMIKAQVDATMDGFNAIADAERSRLNQNSGLQGKIDAKRAIEDRVHFEVIMPLKEQKRMLGTSFETAQAEYTQWWHSTVQALIRQGFPVSGNSN